MDYEYWLNQISNHELKNLFMVSNLKRKFSNLIIYDQEIPETLIIQQDNIVDQLASFYTEGDDHIEEVAHWLSKKDILVETTYDRMVQLFEFLNKEHLPRRFYQFKYVCNRDIEIKGNLDYKIITEAEGNEKFIETGLKEIYRLNKRDISRVVTNSNFLEYLKRGVYVFMIDQTLIGFVMTKHTTDHYVELSNLWVLKKFRGKGYSNEIIKTMAQIFKQEEKCCVVTLKTDQYNMIKLFEDENFELTNIISRENLR